MKLKKLAENENKEKRMINGRKFQNNCFDTNNINGLISQATY